VNENIGNDSEIKNALSHIDCDWIQSDDGKRERPFTVSFNINDPEEDQ
jgi:hypothetical protein